MSEFERRTIGSSLKQWIPVVALALFMVPSVTNAEPLLLLLNDPVPEAVRQTVKRPVDICLNENGDLVIRCSNVLMTLAYSPPNGVIEPQERIRIAQRQDNSSISGISLKFSFPF